MAPTATHTIRTGLFRVAALLVAAVLAGAASGCNIAGPVAFVLAGPPKTDAVHKLDGSRPTVIFVDDRANTMPRRSLRVGVGTEAEQTLIANKVVPQQLMIASQAAMHAAAGERHGATMSIAEIGRSVGAEVIIYVTMDAWTLSQDGATLSPASASRVKILDVVNNTRIWPDADEGHPLIVRMPSTPEDMPGGAAERNAAHQALAIATGRQLARLFFKHGRDALSDQIR
ncbi:MAG: hypothetical protein EA376_13160 [Phycisphaeraceae bacterium]|nr:MAG: hypothetical protein EA376_13160 [Phycisphaeraceae bacterium]